MPEFTGNYFNTRLVEAAGEGALNEVELCLARGADINTKDSYGMTPLYKAVLFGQYQIVEFLMNQHEIPDLEATGEDGETPLWRAATMPDERFLDLLLNKGANVNFKGRGGITPLYRAVLWNCDKAVKRILWENPGIEIRDDDGETPLWRAVTEGNKTTVNLLLRSNADVNVKTPNGATALLQAAICNEADIAEILLDNGARLGAVDAEGDSELSHAAFHGNLQLAESLLKKGADVGTANEVGMTPFLWAARGGHEPVGHLLLLEKADPAAADNDGYTALHWSSISGSVAFTELVLKDGAPVDVDQQSGPRLTIEDKQPETKIVPTKTGVGIESKSKAGETALHIASVNGSEDVVAVLLRNGANINTRDAAQWTALHHASKYGHTKTMELLLNRKAALLTAKNSDGNTALHLASDKKGEGPIALLLKHLSEGVRNIIAEKNLNGETALAIATDAGNKTIVQLLVNNEADISLEEMESGQKWPKMERPNPKQVEAIGALLLDIEFNLEESTKKTLYWAARNGHITLVRKLRTHAALRDTLYWAAVGGQENIIEMLLHEYEKTDPKMILSDDAGPKSVLAAARNGHEQVVQQLLRKMMGFSGIGFIDTRTLSLTKSWTPLHWAVNYNDPRAVEVVRYMLMNGANPEATIGDEGEGVLTAVNMARRLKDGFHLVRTIVSLLETPLRLPRKPIQLVEPHLGPGGLQEVCKRVHANIIDFYPSDGRFYTLERKSAVYDIIYKEGPEKIMSQARDNWNIKLQQRFRWIHIPANNWIWVEDLMRRISYESKQSAGEYTRLRHFVEQNRREHLGKTQCRFMYPALTFENKDFHTGGGANITTLQNQAKKEELGKIKKPKGSQKPENPPEPKTNKTGAVANTSKGIVAGPVQPRGQYGGPTNLYMSDATKERGGKEVRGNLQDVEDRVQLTTIKDNSVTKNDKETKNLERRAEQPEPKQHHTNDQPNKEVPRSGQGESMCEPATVHLEGCRMALCLPYLTFRTVKAHRKLRQAIRLAEEVHRISPKSKNPQENAVLEDFVRPARLALLTNAIMQGNNLLEKTLCDSKRLKLGSCTCDELQRLREAIASINTNDNTSLESKENLKSIEKCLKELRMENTPSEVLEWRERLQDSIDIVKQGMKNRQNDSKTNGLYQQYLRPGEEKGIHTSRSIDQYYYSSLADTSRRDADQVVRRYQTRKWEEEAEHNHGSNSKTPDDDSNFQMGMVDQLWLWVIDDKTVVTCFPKSCGGETKESSRRELVDKIRLHIHEDTRPEISSIYHLATVITSLCAGFIEDCHASLPDGPESFLHMFSGSISIVTDEEVRCFEVFKREISKHEDPHEMDDTSSHSHGLDLQKDIKLLEEIKDIRDELNILHSILEDQEDLLQRLSTLISQPDTVAEQKIEKDPVLNYYRERSDIKLRIEKIRKLQMDAGTAYNSLNHLLDLKQKNANIMEAAQARIQTEQTFKQSIETTKQGRTILVFTIVTIIFLPMSFLSSFFALNIKSFPHADGNLLYTSDWIFSRIFGTSAALTIPLVLIAIYINKLLDLFGPGPRASQNKGPKQPSSPITQRLKNVVPKTSGTSGLTQLRAKLKPKFIYRRHRASPQAESRIERGEGKPSKVVVAQSEEILTGDSSEK
ncbi:uncharacterized protein BP5553_03764 [Venustampulla echinocandica]|uniref:Ankyrin repeat-containing protein n=1 Tax=Venustampulla echinocandica TaxID=2656787 RepID=A0A370TV61_9HELO|nr:uncharacterized protein BP5553_03764 [Venustampulla echinocandica]RDL39424.1 hypothetical protein BP5553_03764 [Venustampulla echinocandica]